jgi:serine/threonine protein kinase/Flp pilus assembly protein TadD
MTAPPLTDNTALESLVAQVVDEFLERQKRGEQPDPAEYAARYPHAAGVLREVLAALRVVGLSSAAGLARVGGACGEQVAVTGTLGDFRIMREVGRGGMGVVYEAEQISLDRRVALKVLPFAAALDGKQLQRFKNEAQAAAHLQHQNIVPVHYVGCERGVHFYAMQFIDGQTLAALIRELRQEAGKEDRGSRMDDRGSKAAGEGATIEDRGPNNETRPCHPRSSIIDSRSSFFRTVATLGVQAAEALEHAHQLGVIHRDIKPANLLVEWRAGGVNPPVLWITDFGLAHCLSQPGLTLSGDLVGTLRYMSPEQALVERVPVDARTDVYSLGVTLYELLTLEPAYNGRTREEVLRQIAFEEPRPPRRLNAEVPAELETIVLKAMAKSPDERYATAQELADDLRRFLEDKPIQARRPTLIQRARKWARRHKPVVAAGLAVLLMGVVAWAVSTVLILRQRDEARAQREVAQTQQQLAQERWELAQAQRQVAQEQRELARRAVDEMYTEVAEKWLAHQPHMQEVQRRFLLKALRYYEVFVQEPGTEPTLRHQAGIAYRRVGDIQFRLGKHAPAEAAYQQAIRLQDELAAAFPAVPEYRRELAASLHSLGTVLVDRGRWAEAEKVYRRALPVREKLAADFPTEPHHRWDVAKSHNNLGLLLEQSGRLREAEQAYGQAIALQEQLTAAALTAPGFRQELAKSHNNLAILLSFLDRPQEAERALHQALAVQAKLVAEFPALPEYRQELAATRNNLAVVLRVCDRLAEAEQALRQAAAVQEKLVTDFPSVTVYRSQLAGTHHNLATVLEDAGRPQEAEQAYRRAVALFENVAAASPGVPALRHELAMSHCQLGGLLEKTRRTDEAVQVYRQAVGWARQAVEAAPQVGIYHRTLGIAQYRAGAWQAADQALHKAVELGAGDAMAWLYLALTHAQRGEKDLARPWYDRASTLLDKSKAAFPQFRALRAEAAALLGLPPPTDPPAKGAIPPGKPTPAAPGATTPPRPAAAPPSGHR